MSINRVAGALGLSSYEAELLADRARSRLGMREYAVRLLAFRAATTPVLRQLIPVGLRRRAIAPLVYALIPGPSENLLYARPSSSDGERAHG